MRDEGLGREDLALLCQYDSPTVCNVIELFEVRPRDVGYMDARISACFPEMPPMVGYACTATRRCGAATRAGDTEVSLVEQLESFDALSAPPVLVFQDLEHPSVAATFGDMMCKTYQTFGAVGLITSGAGRDLEQVRELGFPVFTNGTICSHGYGYNASMGGPVHVGGITVVPGDLLFADCNGVTMIPVEIASEVAQACADYAACEAIVLDYLSQDSPTRAALAEAQAECKRKMAELGQRLRQG
jgi:regulator of RNase E activity RraA